jgi:Ca2+-binding RTX toxin-like protein
MAILNGIYYGTLGDDFLQLSIDTPLAYGRAGDDTFYGSSESNDTLYGNRGNDLLVGNDGDDVLVGGYGFDTLYGGAGADFLNGGAGADSLNGDAGNDILIGYAIGTEFEADTFEGGTGADTFVLGEGFAFYVDEGDEFARILDFSRAEGDKLQVFGSISDYSLEVNVFGVYVNYQNELIAVVDNVTDLSLELDFNLV